MKFSIHNWMKLIMLTNLWPSFTGPTIIFGVAQVVSFSLEAAIHQSKAVYLHLCILGIEVSASLSSIRWSIGDSSSIADGVLGRAFDTWSQAFAAPPQHFCGFCPPRVHTHIHTVESYIRRSCGWYHFTLGSRYTSPYDTVSVAQA